MVNVVVVFMLAAVFGLAAVWAARWAARRIGLVDGADGLRKFQPRPVALAGGLGVLAAVLAALTAAAVVLPDVRESLVGDPLRHGSLLAAALIIAAVGLLDDLLELRARHKLAGQLAAILVLVMFGGFTISQVTLLGLQFPLGYASGPLTVLWFLAAMNALNLLDGMDGLLGTIGVIIFGAVAWMAFAAGHPFVGFVAVAFAGGLFGFLRYNFPPASVYLGDCGSMLIGLMVGALAIESSLKGPAVAILTPAALLVLPILDTSAAIVRRKLTGRGIAVADRGHLHHEMQRNGLTNLRILAVVAALGLVAAGGALVGTFLQNDLFAVLSAVVVALILFISGLFGTAEVRLIKERAVAVLRAAMRTGEPVEFTVRLRGSADWSDVWQRLVVAADEMRLQSLVLDVDAPGLPEGFHGRWNRADSVASPHDVWRVEVPVYGSERPIGRLMIAGVRADGTSMAERFADLARVVAAAESAAQVKLAVPRVI